MTRIIGPPKSRRRHWTFLGALVAALSIGMIFIAGAQSSVNDVGVFQLQGTPTQANPGTDSSADWNNICTTSANNPTPNGCIDSDPQAANRVASAFDYDECGDGSFAQNCTIFTSGGSKDDGDISGWAWKDQSGGLPDKDNLEQAMASRYTYTTTLTAAVTSSQLTLPIANASYFPATATHDYQLIVDNEVMLVTGGQGTNTLTVTRGQGGTTAASHNSGALVTVSIAYFGATRFDNSGDAQIGIWFFQNNVQSSGPPPCTNKIGGGTGFCDPNNLSGTVTHKDGDILILSTFTGGGTTPTIQVWKWVAGGGDNGNTNLKLLNPAVAASCIAVPAFNIPAVDTDTPFCASVNSSTGVSSPWAFTNKAGAHTYDNGEFYEGGLNLAAFPQLASECFGSFQIETRSSQSTSAVLKDFIGGPLQHCAATITTTPSTTSLVLDGSGTQTVTDTAVLDGVGTTTPAGKVQFFFCTPSQLTPANTGTCSTGGTQVIKAGSDATGEPLSETTPGHSSATSGSSPNITAVGRYCWRGVYQPASGSPYTSVSDSSSGECLTVTDSSAVASTQSWVPNDSATASSTGGTALNGTLTIQLYTGTGCVAANAVGSPYSKTLTNATSAADRTLTTNNTTSYTSDVSWLVTFTSSDPNVASPSSSHCENSSLTVTN
jgi:hypothetical protein